MSINQLNHTWKRQIKEIVPGLAQRLSTVKRMSRLLKNKAIAQEWIKAQFEVSQQVKLIIYGTKIG